jgi:hypothetical protein
MSIDDERELRQRLGAALDTVAPRPAPVDAVVRQGRNFMIRRRIGVVAGIAATAAAVAVLGVAGPGWLHRQAGPPPAPALVTVVPPGPRAPAGLIASGVVGTRRWRVIVRKPTPGRLCIQAQGLYCGTVKRATEPVNFELGGGNGLLIQFGPVKRDVTRVDIRLTDGTVLALHPVRAYGRRFVAYAGPLHLEVAEATAYAGKTELGHAIPFDANWTPSFVRWLRPGQTGPARATYKIGSGVTDGTAWSMSEYVGPWGRCFAGAEQYDYCTFGSGSTLSHGQLTSVRISPGPGGGAGLYTAAAAATVRKVRLALSDGTTISPPVVSAAGGQKFYAFGVRKALRVLRWTAYGASGQQIGSGKGGGG